MTLQASFVKTLTKRDFEKLIIWFIGAYRTVKVDGETRTIKQTDCEASTGEIGQFLRSPLLSDGKHSLSLEGKIPRRTLHHYLEDLLRDGFVQRTEKGRYRLTQEGIKEWMLMNEMNKARSHFAQKPIGTYFSFGFEPDGATEYVNIVIHTQEAELVKMLRKALAEERFPGNDPRLGELLLTITKWYYSGLFSKLQDIVEGNIQPFADLLKRIPDDFKPNV